MKKKYGLCMIGAGFIGKKYAEAFANMPNIRLETMCDLNIGFAKDIADRFGFAKIETNWHNAIESPDIDIVCICVPNNMHYEIAASAIKLKKSVLCEKPLTQSSQQSIQLVELALENRVIAACSFNLIYLPAIEYTKRLVESGKLGKIVSFTGYYDNDRLSNPNAGFEWRLAKKNSIGGSISDLGINIIAISLYLFGRIDSVIGISNIVYSKRKDMNGNIKNVENDDLAHLLIKYENGAIGSIRCNRIAVGSKQDMGFTAQFQNGTIHFSLKHMNEIHICTADSDGFTIINSNNGKWFCAGYEELKTKTVEHFVSNIESFTSSETDFLFAAEIDRIIEAIVQSFTMNQWVKLIY